MSKERLSAFSDGVLAIIITIMVLELRAPESDRLASLQPLLPVLLSYVLSFVYVAIYWNNHHHMLYVTKQVNGGILWANMHLLFWLSLVPFATGWMGETHFASAPTLAYGVIMLGAAIAYWILQRAILNAEGPDSVLAVAVGSDIKGKISPVCYLIAIACAYAARWVSESLFVIVALMWLIPDARIERIVAGGRANAEPDQSCAEESPPAAPCASGDSETSSLNTDQTSDCTQSPHPS